MRYKPLPNSEAAAQQRQQFPLYARPDSPKYGKVLYNRSTSPSADSMDNCSSNSSTYSSAYRHPPSLLSQDEDNLILINVGNDVNSRKPPVKGSNLSYRKSFSHVNHRAHGDGLNRKFNGSFIDRSKADASNSQEFINYEKPSISTLTMTKPLAMPSISTSNLYTRRRFATLAHPKEKLQAVNTKSTTSLNENHVYWDPIMDSKIGSQTTLRSKPIVPWWELACKKEHRQSCPPMQVNIFFFLIRRFWFSRRKKLTSIWFRKYFYSERNHNQFFNFLLPRAASREEKKTWNAFNKIYAEVFIEKRRKSFCRRTNSFFSGSEGAQEEFKKHLSFFLSLKRVKRWYSQKTDKQTTHAIRLGFGV